MFFDFTKKFKFLVLFLFVLLIACEEDKSIDASKDDNLITISVFSDPHLYDTTLGTRGEAFQKYLASDRKMLVESEAILQSVIEMISSDNSKIVLVPGDLTKDGELKNHQKFANYLRQLESKGKKVYVVPGNHDVENPESFSYNGNTPVKVNSVSATEFKNIYADFGYKEAIATDPNGSLSYIVEPVSGVWIFCLDACRWKENSGKSHSTTGGLFSDATLNWIKEKMLEGKQKNKLMLGMMHHNIVEHFDGQKMLFTDYVVNNWEEVSRTFAENGLKVVFTGHHHAHDARIYQTGNSFILDIQTSSTVTWPCAIRRIEIDKNWVMKVKSEKITKINYNTGGKPFQDYAKNKLVDGLPLIVNAYLKQVGLPDQVVQLLSPLVVDTYISYTHGNEDQFLTPEKRQAMENAKKSLAGYPQIAPLLAILEGMMKDLEPNDYEFSINLKTGAFGGIATLQPLNQE
ncbi:MAG: metallophosphoesterase [Ignavibacteria bacterium]|nr:metallophosphoesterase [Ignavibacteria bacterium]